MGFDPADNAIDFLALTAVIVRAHIANNQVDAYDFPALINNVYTSLLGLGVTPKPARPDQKPAVSIRSSVTPDYIVCLEDGRKMKMLKRYLMTRYGMTVDAYRAKWGLPFDHPMVAPNYIETRRLLAGKIRLGTKRQVASLPEPVEALSRDIFSAKTALEPTLGAKPMVDYEQEKPGASTAAKPVRRKKSGILVEPYNK